MECVGITISVFEWNVYEDGNSGIHTGNSVFTSLLHTSNIQSFESMWETYVGFFTENWKTRQPCEINWLKNEVKVFIKVDEKP